MNQGKFKATMNSRNFLVNIVTLVMLVFTGAGYEITADPVAVAEGIASGNATVVLGILVPIIFNIVTKLAQNAWAWNWGFLKSSNFWVQFATVVLVGVTAYVGIEFAEDAAGNVITSFDATNIIPFIIALLMNIINPIVHFFKKDKEENESSELEPELPKD